MKRIFKLSAYVAGWLLLVLLLLVAVHLKSPYLFEYRAYETPVVLMLAFGLAVFFGFKTRRVTRVLGLGLLLVVAGFTLWGGI